MSESLGVEKKHSPFGPFWFFLTVCNLEFSIFRFPFASFRFFPLLVFSFPRLYCQRLCIILVVFEGNT